MGERVQERIDELEQQRDAVRELILDENDSLVSKETLRERLDEEYDVQFTVQDNGVVSFEGGTSRFAETVALRAYDMVEESVHPSEWEPLTTERVEKDVERASALEEAIEEHREDVRETLSDELDVPEEELESAVDDVLEEE